ncbi:MAG TPA: ATP-dependent DNA helicase [Rhodopila sp.]|nr:ATP-dependent DNA helicase [Rhodopila sp.]
MNNASIVLPDAPCVVAGHGRAAILTQDGEVLSLSASDAAATLRKLPPPILVHAPATFRRLGMRPSQAFDLLDLFAFVRPAETAAPTPRGLALALDDPRPMRGLEDAVTRLPDLTTLLLNTLAQARDTLLNRDAAPLASRMQQAGWLWGGYVTHALGRPGTAGSNEPLKVWKILEEWDEVAPLPAPASFPVSAAEARTRLAEMLGPQAEQRPGQSDYASAAAAAFAPRETKGDPHLVLAEAGTGTGKTLGYLAPAMLWAEKNKGAVWISTFTRHLQRQIDSELARVIPDPTTRRRRVVVRKGRENYLCLLNLEDAVNIASAGFMNQTLIPLGLIARWAKISDDGDIQGGDLPGWLSELYGGALFAGLADRRGECIHAACPHYRRCFVEHTIRRSRTAELVVANHALVMAQAAWGGLDDSTVPTRYVFDEGHHLFEAADSAFSAALSGAESAELRRWLRGSEGARSRARGIRRRVEDLIADRPDLQTPLDAALHAAAALPPSDWSSRMQEEGPELAGVEPGQRNPTEAFLRVVRHQILARAQGPDDVRAMSLECDVFPPHPDLPPAAETLRRALGRIVEPLELFRTRLLALLADEPDDLDEAARLRIEAIGRSLNRRALMPLKAWQEMLGDVIGEDHEPGERQAHVPFLRLDRRDANRDNDIGLHRHWLDPTIPFAATLATPASGLLVTSATLRDGGENDAERAWEVAEARVGAPHLPSPAIRAAVASPFDYAAQTRAFVVTDLATGNLDQLAGAYKALFLAAGGGALGLFTAISRLRAVHQRIAPDVEAAGLPLYAQHVDAMGNATLVDIFRAEEESCLLGTDAMRDGVDVPGNALRLVVFERTPWPRPDILHRERRVHLSGGDPKAYDDRIVRLRLRQAFGRLIRRTSDRGVFVLLDRQTPSRVMTAFPPGVAVRRLGLAQAIAETAAFLGAPSIRDRVFL